MMKETREGDDPHSDNLFCLENSVSNVMSAVWRTTMDFVAMNRSSSGTADCQGIEIPVIFGEFQESSWCVELSNWFA